MYMLIARKGTELKRMFADEDEALNIVRKVCSIGREETCADLMAMKAIEDSAERKVVISARGAHLTITKV